MRKIRILIADDHSMVRQGLKQIVELEEDMEVVAQASNGEEAVNLAMEVQPDVILMDINMPKVNGIQAIAQLKEKGCSSKIIMLTIHADREYLVKTVQLGAAGYVLKDADSDVLIKAIQSVYKGQSYIQPTMTTELIKEFTKGVSEEHSNKNQNLLTQREIEVLELIAEGMLNKEIAAKLYISEKTVKNHVSNIFKKLNVSDRTQAAIYAFKHNIKKD
ncbi:response regulator [Petroclostridium xylanilyticum]|uniref:response regulator n=1 Tax=Petroclostridium xylanilyticum TaxID=1792311 RepID=UPI000B981A61|nr:response regulator transcription factor [Petroclostridium xylanilyticum]